MNGKVLQERLQELTSIPFTEIAERIGVSPQSMYQFFEAKDVKSGLIEKLCEVLDVDPTMAITDVYIRKSFDHVNEANRMVVDYITGKPAG